MAQRLRCPGGRPSVSYEWLKSVAMILGIKYQLKATTKKLEQKHQPNHDAASQRFFFELSCARHYNSGSH